MTTSAPDSLATVVILRLISLVTWGMICTVFPRYSPRLSFSMTERYTLPVVMLWSLVRWRSMNLS